MLNFKLNFKLFSVLCAVIAVSMSETQPTLNFGQAFYRALNSKQAKPAVYFDNPYQRALDSKAQRGLNFPDQSPLNFVPAQPVLNFASQAASSSKPILGLSANGGGRNGRNWGGVGTVVVGAKAWESQNGRNSVGVAASASQMFGLSQGHIISSRPIYGVGASYKFSFGKK